MLPDIGASELLLIAVVALIIVGPKDLPMLMRKVGQFLARLRGMAAEFRASFDEMARQSELDELRKEVEAMRSGRILGDASATEEPVMSAISDIEQSLADTGAQFHPPMSHQIASPPAETPVAEATAEPAAKAAAKPAAKPRAKAATSAKAKAASNPKTGTKASPKAQPKAKAGVKAAAAKPAAAKTTAARKPRAKKAEA